MGLEEIVPAIFLIAVLILVLPEFLRSNSKSKRFIKNLLDQEGGVKPYLIKDISGNPKLAGSL